MGGWMPPTAFLPRRARRNCVVVDWLPWLQTQTGTVPPVNRHCRDPVAGADDLSSTRSSSAFSSVELQSRGGNAVAAR